MMTSLVACMHLDALRPYTALLRMRCRMLLQYRTAALAGFVTQLFWGYFKVLIFTSLYLTQTNQVDLPLTLEQTITFIWIAQLLLGLLPWNVDKEIEQQIRTGQVAYELLRPVHLYSFWFLRSIAMRLIPTLLRSLPFIACALLGVIRIPFVSYAALVIFLSSCFMALLLSAAITTLMSISLFWTLSGKGIQRLLPHVACMLSGLMIPLPMFPSWMQPLLEWQPFRGILDMPSRLYTGVIPVHEGLSVLLFQGVWVLLLALTGTWAMRAQLRRCIVDGG